MVCCGERQSSTTTDTSDLMYYHHSDDKWMPVLVCYLQYDVCTYRSRTYSPAVTSARATDKQRPGQRRVPLQCRVRVPTGAVLDPHPVAFPPAAVRVFRHPEDLSHQLARQTSHGRMAAVVDRMPAEGECKLLRGEQRLRDCTARQASVMMKRTHDPARQPASQPAIDQPALHCTVHTTIKVATTGPYRLQPWPWRC